MKRLATILCTLLLLSATVSAGQNVVVVLDDSGSMAERMRSQRIAKMDAAKQALIAVLGQLPQEANVGVVLLNGTVNGSSWVVPLGKVDMDRARETIRQVQANGGTPLGRFMKVGADELLKLRSEDHYGTYRLLVVTDGEANDGKLVERYLPDIKSRGIAVDAIGVDMASNHSLATRADSYRRADDPDSLVAAVKEVFAEVSDQGSDADETDFELLESIPMEIASAALTALSDIDNRPIGLKRAVGGGGGNQAPSPLDNTSQGTGSSGQSTGGPNFFTYLVVAIIVLGLFQMVRAATRAAR